LQRSIASVLLDDEQSYTSVIASLDELMSVAPARRHRLLCDDVKTRLSRADTLLRVNAAWRCEDDCVCIAVRKEIGVLTEALGAGASLRCFESAAIRVANPNQLSVACMLLQRLYVFAGDAAATHKCEADLAVRDWAFSHV
jgi:hypothetical protein